MATIGTIRTDAYTAMYNLLSDASKGITNNSNIHSRYNDNKGKCCVAYEVINKVCA